jgi:hypothetical protein
MEEDKKEGKKEWWKEDYVSWVMLVLEVPTCL